MRNAAIGKILTPFILPALLFLAAARSGDYASMRSEAERYYAEKSFSRAREAYIEAAGMDLPAGARRWVEFRLADTLWRSQAATRAADEEPLEEARVQLEKIVAAAERLEDRDLVWAEAQESLGDFWWMRKDVREFAAAWEHYGEALDWWGGSTSLEEAGRRFMAIIRKAAIPPWKEGYYYYGYFGNYLPPEVVEDALKVAASPEDKAFALYLSAVTAAREGSQTPGGHRRTAERFEQALKAGRSEWYDDALFQYAEWLNRQGGLVRAKGGRWQVRPDYPAALAAYRRFLEEFRKGESPHYDQAAARAREIVRPDLRVSVSSIFLPGSRIEYDRGWRNVGTIEFSLDRVDLTADVDLSGAANGYEWLPGVRPTAASRLRSWKEDTGDAGDHVPGGRTTGFEEPLPPGAYLLEARGGGVSARELILVTDMTLVVKTAGGQVLVHAAGAEDGAPVAGADVSLWARVRGGGDWTWKNLRGRTDADGLCVIRLDAADYAQVFAAAAKGERQAFCPAYVSGISRQASWRLYAFTERPAYRPGDEARWKVTARTHDGLDYATPSGRKIGCEIRDPRGGKVREVTLTLNLFGSAWDSLPLTPAMPLGEYTVFFRDGDEPIGQAVLFRLEEYKLPEFKVGLILPEKEGRKVALRPGDTAPVGITAEYYFGGPVAGAEVEVVVRLKPYYPFWRPPSEFPWLFEDSSPHGSRGWGGEEIQRETLRTDDEGRAEFLLRTRESAGQDQEYAIEARVTDASRREITGGGTVRVSLQAYYVRLEPDHRLLPPGGRAAVAVEAKDANDQPVKASGTLTVTRDYWWEEWTDPEGRAVKGDEVKELRRRNRVFPPPPPEKECRAWWRPGFQGYQHETVSTRTIATGEDGRAEFAFSPARDGFYRLAWESETDDIRPVTAEAVVWCATSATEDLDYVPGGLEIIVDREAARAGRTLPVMVLAPAAGHVLFTIEGDEVYNYKLFNLRGTSRLVELTLEDKDAPNIFLWAGMVRDRRLLAQVKEVLVPRAGRFLEVKVAPNRPDYRPGEEGTLEVTARDDEGKPAAAEVALSLVDEAVFYIQPEYNPDPRPFFYGGKRANRVQTVSTFGVKPYARLAKKAAVPETITAGREDMMEAEPGFARGGAPAPMMMKAAASRAEMVVPSSPMAAMREEAAPGEPAVRVRADFRATAFWRPDVVTGPDGKASVKFVMPDSLTSWRATARAATSGSSFGRGEASARTRLPLAVRLQAPRFFVVGDKATVSALVNNNSGRLLKVEAELAVRGLVLSVPGRRAVAVPDGGEARLDWTVEARLPGPAFVKVAAGGEGEADAMEKEYPVLAHGLEKFLHASGKMTGAKAEVVIDLPRDRRPGSSTMLLQLSPSLAVTMLDALPYLADYPYGCTEQTMSRFLPAAVTIKTLRDLGMSPRDLDGRLFGGIEQAAAAGTRPGGHKDLSRLEDMVRAGLQRLYDFQHADGGWGWWKAGESDRFMTAYVVWGLGLAERADVSVKKDVLERAAAWLDAELVNEEGDADMQAWMLHALASLRRPSSGAAPGEFQTKAFNRVWESRDRLNAYTRALLALAAHRYGLADKAAVLVRNMENGVIIDRSPGASILGGGGGAAEATAHWGEDGLFWRWSEGGVEATATALRALLAVDPKNALVGPVTGWLIRNRRGAQWSNTRDTAMAVLALNDYLRVSGELAGEVAYEVAVNGRRVTGGQAGPGDIPRAPSLVEVDPSILVDGANTVTVNRLSGSGPLYFSAQARFFSLEEPITPAGSGLFIDRRYLRLTGEPTLLKGKSVAREVLPDGGTAVSGERIETVLTLEAKNNLEYVVLEDRKPAGFEAVQVRSGESLYARELTAAAARRRFGGEAWAGASPPEESDYTGRTRWVYQELRDDRAAIFVDKLPQGFWEIRHELRAEVPGSFHALPPGGHAMYVPEIRGNGAEARVLVGDRPR